MTMRGRTTLFVALILVAAAGQPARAQASCSLAGEIVAGGQGLEGVTLRLREGVQLRTIATSDPDGRFSFDVNRLQPNRSMILVYEKAGFLTFTQSLDADPVTRCPVMPRRQIALESQAGRAGAVDTGAPGRMLFISPYALYGDVDDSDEQRLNGIVDQVIGHRIQAYRTSLKLTQPPSELSVRKLEEPLSMVDRARIRDVGSQRQALGVITGEGELRPVEDGDDVIDLFSEFSIIPRHPNYAERRLEVGDTLPRGRARPSRLSAHLNEFWGQKAMIALSVQELAILPASASPDELLQIRALLIAVRSTMGADDPLLGELEQLLDHVKEEVGE
jgi:hypothetical protein